ncbi:MAG TPA: c-type cytochrome [Acidobacteriaceae bacterium]|jgi:mono/diheme cytochrome c family protein|nr:c-type cytochrome [Acidobacteriaceae bacterium]
MRWFPIAVAAAFPLLLALSGCGHLPGATSDVYPPPRPDQVLDFPALYNQNCQACHGTGGENGPAMDLANPEFQALIDDNRLRNIISNGLPGTQMPAWAQSAGGMLTDQQIDAIIAGMRKEWARPDVFAGVTPPPFQQPAGGNAQHGSQLYQAHCAMCHTGPARQQLISPVYLSLVSDDALRSIIVAGRPDIGQPDWRHDDAKGAPQMPLSGQDITDIVAYLGSLRNPSTVSAAPIPVPPRR